MSVAVLRNADLPDAMPSIQNSILFCFFPIVVTPNCDLCVAYEPGTLEQPVDGSWSIAAL